MVPGRGSFGIRGRGCGGRAGPAGALPRDSACREVGLDGVGRRASVSRRGGRDGPGALRSAGEGASGSVGDGALRDSGEGAFRSVGRPRQPRQRTRRRRRENAAARGFLGALARLTLALDRSVSSFCSERPRSSERGLFRSEARRRAGSIDGWRDQRSSERGPSRRARPRFFGALVLSLGTVDRRPVRAARGVCRADRSCGKGPSGAVLRSCSCGAGPSGEIGALFARPFGTS